MGKDRKGKSEGKKAKMAEKKAKQEKKGEKKDKIRASKADDSDAEDVDLDAVLAEYKQQQEAFLMIKETVCDPPRARANSTLIASPANDNEIFLFGGEYFNGALATFFNDLYVYFINKDEWRLITSPNTPLPRSGHAWCRGGNAGNIYLFGGEFSSPKQGTFYHYNDFWRFEPSNREWTRLDAKGKSPPARSGHRMTYHKKYIILFGGFQDTSQQTKYLGDLWVYDIQNFVWFNPIPPMVTQKPDARSSFSFLPHESGAVLYGGYSRVKATMTSKQMKGGNQAQRNVLRPVIHQDCFFLRVIQPGSDTPLNTSPTIRWERRKKPANAPSPARAGATMTYHKGRGIMFGGVHDREDSEEAIDSEFFNTLFAWNIERNRYFPLMLRKARQNQRKPQGEARGSRRGRGQANEEELLKNLTALQTGKSLADVDNLETASITNDPEEHNFPAKEVSMQFPHPRFNAQLAVQGDILYIYGGTFEKTDAKEDREYTFDEMYSIDLGRLDGVKQIFRREPENWLGSEDEESEDGDRSDEDDEDAEEDEEGNVKMEGVKPLYIGSTRKLRKEDRLPTLKEEAKEASTPAQSVFDDTADESATASSADDKLPHPRPFESRRDFFQRTGNEWQEALMTSLSWKGIQPETLSVKEIKTRAFEMSEEKWWDSREEVTALEDEQEAAGIGEIVTLAEKVDAGVGAGRRR